MTAWHLVEQKLHRIALEEVKATGCASDTNADGDDNDDDDDACSSGIATLFRETCSPPVNTSTCEPEPFLFGKMRAADFPEIEPVPNGWSDGIREAGFWYRTLKGHLFHVEWSKNNHVDWWVTDLVHHDKYAGRGRQTLRAALGLVLTRFVRPRKKRVPKKSKRWWFDSEDDCVSDD